MNFPAPYTIPSQDAIGVHTVYQRPQTQFQINQLQNPLAVRQIPLQTTPLSFYQQTPKSILHGNLNRPQLPTLIMPPYGFCGGYQPQLMFMQSFPVQIQQNFQQNFQNISNQQFAKDQINNLIINRPEINLPSTESTVSEKAPKAKESLDERNEAIEQVKDTAQRIIEKFKLPPGTRVDSIHGESIDLSTFRNKVHVPNTKKFTQIKYTSPSTGRTSNAFACDYDNCGKLFRKWHNLFDHLRIHTNEKPFVCPVEGCGMEFNQVSNHKKHIDTHKARPYLTCSCCKEKFTKNKLLSHFNSHQPGLIEISDLENV